MWRHALSEPTGWLFAGGEQAVSQCILAGEPYGHGVTNGVREYRIVVESKRWMRVLRAARRKTTHRRQIDSFAGNGESTMNVWCRSHA